MKNETDRFHMRAARACSIGVRFIHSPKSDSLFWRGLRGVIIFIVMIHHRRRRRRRHHHHPVIHRNDSLFFIEFIHLLIWDLDP